MISYNWTEASRDQPANKTTKEESAGSYLAMDQLKYRDEKYIWGRRASYE